MSSAPSGDPKVEVPYEAEIVDAPRPTGSLSLISTIAILAALTGVATICMGGGLALTSYNAAAPLPPAAGASAVNRFQYDLQVEWQGITQLYLPGLVAFTLWHVVVLLLLLIGGIRLLRQTPSARTFMLYVLLSVIVFEVLRTGMYLSMMLEMMPMVDTSFQRAMQQAGPADSQMAKILRRMANGVTIMAILFALVWPAIKLLFYGWAAKYLASREAIEICQR